jgi:glucosamine-6-phosphate deaminase
MRIEVFEDPITLGKAAAAVAAETIEEAVEARGHARIIAATGASQLAFLDALSSRTELPWSRVEMFHLDEYIGLPITHPASFRKYLLERLIRKAGLTTYHLLDGEADPELVCQEVGRALAAAPIDVAFVGIGENGHLAFNDPPADFDTEQPYLIVTLDEACRRQQVGEGWFTGLDEVPQQAISMSIRQILKSRRILCIVPDLRKAEAVKACFTGRVNPMAPASILRTHPDTTLFLDFLSASLLDPATIARGEL